MRRSKDEPGLELCRYRGFVRSGSSAMLRLSAFRRGAVKLRDRRQVTGGAVVCCCCRSGTFDRLMDCDRRHGADVRSAMSRLRRSVGRAMATSFDGLCYHALAASKRS